MKHLLILLFSVSLFFTCKNKPAPNTVSQPEQTTDQAATDQAKSAVAPPQAAFQDFNKTVHCEKIKFEVTAQNGETSIIKVVCNDLTIRKYQEEFTVQGHLKYAFGTDQNEDGFCELYLAVEKNNGSGDLDIIGIASFNDKSAGEITIRDVALPRRKNSDKVYVYYDKLKREFHDEQGTLHVYDYGLTKGEASYILQAMRLK